MSRRGLLAVGRSTRWGLAFAAGATAVAVSYALQRLASAWAGEADWTQILRQVHVAFYWRCGLALLHGALVTLTLGLWVDDDRAELLLRFAPVWVPLCVLPLALAMVAVP